MDPNKLTPGHNLMWESSRMMLPEHKARIREHQRELQKHSKPILDEQQMELFSQNISDALNQDKNLKIQLFHPYHVHHVTGKVQKVIPGKQLKLVSDKDIQWVNLTDIMDISII